MMKSVVVWQRIDIAGLEYAELESGPLRLEGDVLLLENGEPSAVGYRVECDGESKTVRAGIRLKHQGARRECLLERSPGDHWTLDGIPMPHLQGVADVDLSITPSTNTPPIRRLGLAVGQRAEVTAAWVRFPALDVVPLRQSYCRVGVRSYRYEAPELHFATEIECDDEGIVLRYGDLWKRVP
jgi:hypothetical protein